VGCTAPAQQPTDEADDTEPTEAADGGGEAVTLTMGSWRVDDVEQMGRILAAFHEEHPNITIEFDPTNPPEYNAALRT
jgi:raffinose/stachyose/melibiose transport system substrate-binding protein